MDNKQHNLKTLLFLLGSLLGPLNLAIFYAAGARLNRIPFYEKMSNLQLFQLWSGLWLYLLLVPSIVATAITLQRLWNELLRLNTTLEHVRWGIKFGIQATITSCLFLLLCGVFYNYSRGITPFGESLFSLVMVVPGSIALGAIFSIIFSPVILPAGAIYGWVAQWLKSRLRIVNGRLPAASKGKLGPK